MTMEGNCTWCAAGKYQTGVGLVAEANCTRCAAGKYQSGSGVHLTGFPPAVEYDYSSETLSEQYRAQDLDPLRLDDSCYACNVYASLFARVNLASSHH